MSSYRKEWRSYRRRVLTAFAAWVIPPVIIYLLGVGGSFEIGMIAAWLLLFTTAMVWLYSFRCPRCQEWFFIIFPTNHPLAKACVHCGLPKHASSDPDESNEENN